MILNPLNKSGFFSNPLSARRSQLLSVLDIGSSKVSCAIARIQPCIASQKTNARPYEINVLGTGQSRSNGIRHGVIVNLEQAQNSVLKALDSAEYNAQFSVDSLIVAISGGDLRSETLRAGVHLHGREIEKPDIARVLSAACRYSRREKREVVHALPIGYRLDDINSISNPIGMSGDFLSMDTHIISVFSASVRTLELCLNHCRIRPKAIVASALTAGLAVLSPDEMEMGTICLDIGSHMTSASVFVGGRFVALKSMALGGHSITLDIARCFDLPIEEASRIKALYGSSLDEGLDMTNTFTISCFEGGGFDNTVEVQHGQLNHIIRKRLEEMFKTIHRQLDESGFAGGYRYVLTGGVSHLDGVNEVAGRLLGGDVRLGKPLGFKGIPEEADSPALASLFGLFVYPQSVYTPVAHTKREDFLHKKWIELRESLGWIGKKTGNISFN